MNKQDVLVELKVFSTFYSAVLALSDDEQSFPDDWLVKTLLTSKREITAWQRIKKAVGFTCYDAKHVYHKHKTFDAHNEFKPVVVYDIMMIFAQRVLKSNQVSDELKALTQLYRFESTVNAPNQNPKQPTIYLPNVQFEVSRFKSDYLANYHLEVGWTKLINRLFNPYHQIKYLFCTNNEYIFENVRRYILI